MTLGNVDQYLGMVNTCDSNGITCSTWYAFKDSDNGRIYLAGGIYTDINDNTIAAGSVYYAQKSNDSRWEYMIRNGDNWEYFSL